MLIAQSPPSTGIVITDSVLYLNFEVLDQV